MTKQPFLIRPEYKALTREYFHYIRKHVDSDCGVAYDLAQVMVVSTVGLKAIW